jgi:hypothetical protein
MDPALFIPGLATLAAALVGTILRYRYRVKKLALERYRIEIFSRALGDAALIGNVKLVEAVGAAYIKALHETSPDEPARHLFQKQRDHDMRPKDGESHSQQDRAIGSGAD